MTETMKPKKDNSKATEESRRVRAQQKADRERGRRLDETLLPQIEALKTLARTNYAGRELEDVLLFIDMAREFHRGLNWRKKSIQTLDRNTLWTEAEESDLPFEDTKYLLFFTDAWAHSMLELARSTHLVPELVKFWTESLERAVKWFEENPENLEPGWLEEIGEELEARKAGKDTYGIIRRPVGRPRKHAEPYRPEQMYR